MSRCRRRQERRPGPALRAAPASVLAMVLLALAVGGCAGWPRVHVAGAGDDIEEWRIGLPF